MTINGVVYSTQAVPTPNQIVNFSLPYTDYSPIGIESPYGLTLNDGILLLTALGSTALRANGLIGGTSVTTVHLCGGQGAGNSTSSGVSRVAQTSLYSGNGGAQNQVGISPGGGGGKGASGINGALGSVRFYYNT